MNSPVQIFPRLPIPAQPACTRAWWATSQDSTRVCERTEAGRWSETRDHSVSVHHRKTKQAFKVFIHYPVIYFQ